MARKRTKKGGGEGFRLLAAAIVGAAGSYWLYGAKEARKNRARVRGWMLKARGEVLEKLEGMQDVDKETYDRVVDRVKDKYARLKSTSTAEVRDFARELKSHWSEIVKEAAKDSRAPRKKKSARKTRRS